MKRQLMILAIASMVFGCAESSNLVFGTPTQPQLEIQFSPTLLPPLPQSLSGILPQSSSGLGLQKQVFAEFDRALEQPASGNRGMGLLARKNKKGRNNGNGDDDDDSSKKGKKKKDKKKASPSKTKKKK